MIEPTERTLWLLAVSGIVGALGIAMPAVGLAAPYALAGLALFVVVDVILAGSPGAVVVQRVLPERCTEGRPAEFALALRCPRRVDVEVVDTLPGADEPWLAGRAVVDVDDGATLRAQRTFARRGRWPCGRIAVRTHGPLGLVRRRQRRVLPGVVNVSVDLAAVVARAERIVRGAESEGARRKRAVERGRELDSLREYRRGDDVRLVDWKASARTGTLIVKELVPETRQDVVVVLDAGRQFCGHQGEVRPGASGDIDGDVDGDVDGDGSGGDAAPETAAGTQRFVLAEQIALLVGASALLKGDRAGLLVLGDDVVAFEPPREGRAQLKRIADATAVVDAEPVEPAYQTLPAFLGARLKRRALVCVITDVVDEAAARALAQGLAGLRGRHLLVVVAVSDPALHRLATAAPTAGDPLGALVPVAAERLLTHRRRALAALEAIGAVVVDAPGARAAASAVDAYLALKSQGRL
jgi:uncharacterized protein (DUF58 family)